MSLKSRKNSRQNLVVGNAHSSKDLPANSTGSFPSVTAHLGTFSNRLGLEFDRGLRSFARKRLALTEKIHLKLQNDQGDVPGWVLVVLMTTGLITGIWTVAAPRLSAILTHSLDSMNNIRQVKLFNLARIPLFASNNYKSLVKSDEGSVESALVLIPTTMLFLGVLQISGFFLFQTGNSNFTQGMIARAALAGSTQNLDQIEITSIALPGGGSILVGSRRESAPVISPLLSSRNNSIFTGIAVREN